jgi:hypothetical protein
MTWLLFSGVEASLNRPAVELGYRAGFGAPVILLCKESRDGTRFLVDTPVPRVANGDLVKEQYITRSSFYKQA